MEGVNNAFCMSKEQYEIARLATKCAGLQGKIDDQAAEIAELREQVFWLKAARSNIAVVAENEKLKTMCDQMGNALSLPCDRWNATQTTIVNEALDAWREMK